MKTIIFGLLTLFLGASGLWYALTSNFNFGNLLVWLMALASLCYALFHHQIDAFTAHGVGFVLKVLFFAGCAFFMFVLGVILWGQWGSAPQGDEKIVVVLGCAVHGETPSAVLQCRLDAAYDYYLANPDCILVVCGGQFAGEEVAEGVAMQRYLIEKGVPEEQILCDDASVSTQENFLFAKTLLEEAGYSAEQAMVFVTNGFHCARATEYAKNAGFSDVSALAASVPPMQILPCYLREVFATVYYWAFKSPDTGFLKNYIGLLSIFGKS